jgi:cytochrome oxidase Cu insertion factor (SCO1/SenC/PrrC family)
MVHPRGSIDVDIFYGEYPKNSEAGQDMKQDQQQVQTRSRLGLVMLALIFIAPILFAFIVYKYRDLIPTETKNFGELVVPARPLPAFDLQTVEGKDFNLEDMRSKWSYLYVVKNHCDADCKLNLLKMRNARLGQGGEAQRVRYYLLYTRLPDNKNELAELSQTYEKLTILTGNKTNTQPLLNTLQGVDGTNLPEVSGAKRVYMIDPIGNYMMYYNNGFEAIGIMEDLKFLLKSSQIG